MTTPFDQLASAYAELWSDTARGRLQREQVWSMIDGLFGPGDRVLDLGCGTGDDAVHLMARGVEVVGIDASAPMVEIARSRGVDARVLDVAQALVPAAPALVPVLGGRAETSAETSPGAAGTRGCATSFSGVLSNFGVLNCVRNLHAVADELSRALAPGAFAALCVMGRYRLREPRRWRGRARWRGMNVFYRSSREMERTFAPDFSLVNRVSIGGGDHTLFVFERQP